MSIPTDFNQFAENVALAWVVTLLTLIVVHLLLWRQPWRLKPPAPYVIGVLILLGGDGVWAFLQAKTGPVSPWLAFIARVAIASAGAIIILAYYIHGGVRSLREMIDTQRRARRAVDRVLEDLDAPDDPRRN